MKREKTPGKLKRNIFEVIQIGSKGDFISRAFDFFIVIVIVSNIACMYMDTFDEFSAYHEVFYDIEFATIIVFVIEFLLRIWTADLLYPAEKPAAARIKFLISFDGVIDFLTILPFFFLSGMVAFRMLRVVRILHLFRLNSNSDSFSIIVNVLYEKRRQIGFSVFFLLVLMLGGSLCIYSAEHEANPEQFRNAFSGIWWAMATVFTIGYGDIYPVTAVGKIVTIIMGFLGVGFVAIPTGIISAGFVEHYNREAYRTRLIDVEHIGEIVVDRKSAGMDIGSFAKAHNCRVFLVVRNGLALLPTENLLCEEGDIMILHADGIEKNLSRRTDCSTGHGKIRRRR